MGELHENTSLPTIRALDYRFQYHGGGQRQQPLYKGHEMTTVITPTPEESKTSLPPQPTTIPGAQSMHNVVHPLKIQILPSMSQGQMNLVQNPGNQVYPDHRVCMHQQQSSLPMPSPSSASAKRPSNSWILYRKEKHPQVLAQNPDISNNEISKIVAKMWKNEPESVKDKYKLQAQIERNMHRQLYPDYKYAPRKNKVRRNRWAASKSASGTTSTNPQQRQTSQHFQNFSQSRVHPHVIIPQWQNSGQSKISHNVYQQQSPTNPQNYQIHQHENFNELNYLFNPYQSPSVSDTRNRPTQQQTGHPQQQKNYYYMPQQYVQQQNQTPTPISPHPEKMFLSPSQYRQDDLVPTPTSAQHDPTSQNTQKLQIYHHQDNDLKSKDCHPFSQRHLCSSPNSTNFLQQQ